jgi:hypothetical protein
MSLIQLVYVSSASKPFSAQELVVLLECSRRNNAQVGITGLLLYREGNFMQALEGEAAEVSRLHDRIAIDPRHRGLITLVKRPLVERAFAEWAMGFRNLDAPEVRGQPGYSEFLNEDWLGTALQKNPDHAMKLLHLFRRGMS